MKPTELATALIDSYHAKTPTMIWGQPGVGKSQITNAVAETLGIPIIDQRLSQMDPVDMRGIPYTFASDGKTYTQWAIPGFLPRADRDGENGILFLDEITSAPQSNQAAAYQLILDRKLGEYELPDGWVVIAAGNRAEDRAISIRMSSALANRFGHYELEVDNEEWHNWAIKFGIDPDITAFIRYRPKLLNDFDPDRHAFPTPRSWEMFNKHYSLLTDRTRFARLKAFVGEGTASEFIAFFKHRQELPEFAQIIQDPKNCKIPQEASALYALAGMVAARAEKSNFKTILEYLDRISAEYQVIAVQDSLKHNPDLGSTQEFIDWSVKNNEVIL